MVEVISTTKLPVRLLYSWARTRFTDHADKSPLVITILNDPFFLIAANAGVLGTLTDSDSFNDHFDDTHSCGSHASRASKRSQSVSVSGTGVSDSIYIVANYWGFATMTVHAMSTIETGLKVNGAGVRTQVVNSAIPPQQTQYIPAQWINFLNAVTNGQSFKHDDHLYRLLTKIGFPYVDTSYSDTIVKYHYVLDVLSLNNHKNNYGHSFHSHLSLSLNTGYTSTLNTTPNGTVIPPHPPTPTQQLSRLAAYTSGDASGQTSMTMSSSSQRDSSQPPSFNLPSFNNSGIVNILNGSNNSNESHSQSHHSPNIANKPYDPHIHQPTHHRALPNLFKELIEHDPIRKSIYKSLPQCDYIKEHWFLSFLKIMPFLYWASQAYANTIQNGLDIARMVRDGIDEKTGEIRGEIAFRLLTDHCCKLNDSSKDPSQQIFFLIVILCKVLTTGSNLESFQRTPFMNKLFQYLGDGNKFNIVDVAEFLLCAEWIGYLYCDLHKSTKSIMKRFKDSQWVTVAPNTIVPGSPTLGVDNIHAVSIGVSSWKELFVSTLSGLEEIHEFMNSKDEDSCNIM